MLREEHLDCDNYAALTGHFVGILLPDHPNTFAVVGLDGGKVGNHAQVFLRVAEHRRILADPTVGIIAATGYDNLFSGNPVPPEKVQGFYAYNDPNILKFGKVTSGRYRPSEMLYYFADFKTISRHSEPRCFSPSTDFTSAHVLASASSRAYASETSQLHRRKRLAKIAGTSGGAALQQRH